MCCIKGVIMRLMVILPQYFVLLDTREESFEDWEIK